MRREKIGIVATKLPKMGGKKKELWQPSCRNLRKEFNSDFGNGLEEKKKRIVATKLLKS